MNCFYGNRLVSKQMGISLAEGEGGKDRNLTSETSGLD